MNLILLVLAGIFVNNYVLSQFLGICPFLGVSKKVDTAAGMGMAVIFVMSLAAAVAWLVYAFILEPLGITYLYNIAFILVIASLVQFVEMFLKKAAPALYQALGVFLPLITTTPLRCRSEYAEGLQLHSGCPERAGRRNRFCAGYRAVCGYP